MSISFDSDETGNEHSRTQVWFLILADSTGPHDSSSPSSCAKGSSRKREEASVGAVPPYATCACSGMDQLGAQRRFTAREEGGIEGRTARFRWAKRAAILGAQW